MDKLITRRLWIAPVTLREAPVIACCITEKISHWTAPIPWLYTIHDAQWWINNTVPSKRLGIYLLPKATLIGTIATPSADGDEVGFWINAQSEKKGYATEAASVIIDHVFTHTSIAFPGSSVHRDNTPSRRVRAKLGFTEIEETQRYWPNKQAMMPVILYRLTKQNWNKTHDE